MTNLNVKERILALEKAQDVLYASYRNQQALLDDLSDEIRMQQQRQEAFLEDLFSQGAHQLWQADCDGDEMLAFNQMTQIFYEELEMLSQDYRFEMSREQDRLEEAFLAERQTLATKLKNLEEDKEKQYG